MSQDVDIKPEVRRVRQAECQGVVFDEVAHGDLNRSQFLRMLVEVIVAKHIRVRRLFVMEHLFGEPA